VAVRLIQHGRSLFLDPSHNVITFSHPPRFTSVVYTDAGTITDLANNLGQDQTFAGLSPFATWTLVVSPDDNVNPDVSQVTEIDFDFAGFFFPFTQ
jgi:hypothetical protein